MMYLGCLRRVRRASRRLEELLAGMMSPHHPSRLIYRRSRGRCIPLVLLGAFGVALLSFVFTFTSTGTAHAAANTRAPGGNFANPVVRAVDIAEPAIVRLATLYEGHIELDLCGQAVVLPASGNPYTVGGLGSGAFISANGDILTADHVVHIDKTTLDDEIFQSPRSAADIANALNAHAGCLGINFRFGATDIENGYVQYLGIPYRTTYSEPRRLVWQSTSYSGPILVDSSDNMLKVLLAAPYKEASLVTSSTFDQNDLAVLHVSLTDTPSIQLDDSSDVAVEDQLTVVGFPGNGDVYGNATDLLTPSVNSVMVSAIKSGQNGSKLIQVGGNVEHGDSGGPALDATGHIVGIVSFAGDDPRGSTAFMRTSNNARTLITSAGVSMQPGAFQKLWEQAFADYASIAPGHWHKAARELDALSASYPSFKGVQDYQKFADAAAQTESTAAVDLSSQSGMLIAAAVAGVVILAVVLVVFFVVRRRRARAALAPAMAGQSLPSAPYGSTPYGGYSYPPAAGYGPYGGYGPPTAGGYGGYGTYAPPSSLRPANGTSNMPAGVVAMPPTTPPEVSGSTTLQELASGQPARMSFPPSSPVHGMASSEYYCANGHSMSSSAVYCNICGAPRQSDSAYSPYSSRP